jgi:hypothetical protein
MGALGLLEWGYELTLRRRLENAHASVEEASAISHYALTRMLLVYWRKLQVA